MPSPATTTSPVPRRRISKAGEIRSQCVANLTTHTRQATHSMGTRNWPDAIKHRRHTIGRYQYGNINCALSNFCWCQKVRSEADLATSSPYSGRLQPCNGALYVRLKRCRTARLSDPRLCLSLRLLRESRDAWISCLIRGWPVRAVPGDVGAPSQRQLGGARRRIRGSLVLNRIFGRGHRRISGIRG